MTKDVLSVSPTTPASDALAWMLADGVRHAAVSSGGVVVGVVSDRDLGGPHGGAVRRARSVGDLMTDAPVTIGPDARVDEAASLMTKHHIGCLPVVEGGKLVGIVTRGDLIRVLDPAAWTASAPAGPSADAGEVARAPAPKVPGTDPFR